MMIVLINRNQREHTTKNMIFHLTFLVSVLKRFLVFENSLRKQVPEEVNFSWFPRRNNLSEDVIYYKLVKKIVFEMSFLEIKYALGSFRHRGI